jgi:hypothetical protein
LARPSQQVRVRGHNDESVEREVEELEMVKDVGLMFFRLVVPQQKFPGDEGDELQRGVEACGEFLD